MDYSFFDFLRLIGSLGLFLYGMKIMSEGLQKFAGDSLRRILTAMTTNRVTGVLTGVLITALIQSSSATTVMVVSFVNAGLLTLTQSIGVIMGANIGTTVTAWLISALGFKVDIAAFSLPLLAFGIPLLFSGKSSRKSVGEFIFGFSFLFMGLQALKANAPDLGANPEMLAFVQNYADMGFFSIILFLFIGAILTMIVQASAATMAITLIMCANGWIDYQLGVALVLGENIGTTITANLAALTGNTQARRAALAHLAFNIFGVIWVLILFYPFTNAVSWFVTNVMRISDPSVAVSFKLAAFHTAFNISNTFVMIWFVGLIEKTVCFLIKGKKDEDEKNKDKEGKEGGENEETEEETEEQNNNSNMRKTEKASVDSDGYLAFKLPWSVSLSYSYSIREDRSKDINIKTMRYPYSLTHSLNVSGNFKIGSRWNMTYSTGYDFTSKEMSMTTLNITRDLHCFNMSCGLVFGPFTSYNFSIRANSSMLTDALKWDQRSNTGSAVNWY
mgnify:CR=1 FL=1